MTATSRNHKYSAISSFEDFRVEKERLLFREKLTEAKLNLNFSSIVRVLSFSSLFNTVSREIILPKISQILGIIISRLEKKPASDEDKKADGETVQN
jgi:hypothetical protein